jgi:hypothetical protein
VGKPNGQLGYLPVKGVSKSPVLNFTAVHFSSFPNKLVGRGLKKNSKVDCINLKTGLYKVEKWTVVHSSKKGGIEWTRFTSG